MPIAYERDDHRRLIRMTLSDPFAFDELLTQVEQQLVERAWTYAVLYDGRTTRAVTPASELQHLLERVHVVGRGVSRGPVAIMIPPRPDMFSSGLHLSQRLGSRSELEILGRTTSSAR